MGLFINMSSTVSSLHLRIFLLVPALKGCFCFQAKGVILYLEWRNPIGRAAVPNMGLSCNHTFHIRSNASISTLLRCRTILTAVSCELSIHHTYLLEYIHI